MNLWSLGLARFVSFVSSNRRNDEDWYRGAGQRGSTTIRHRLPTEKVSNKRRITLPHSLNGFPCVIYRPFFVYGGIFVVIFFFNKKKLSLNVFGQFSMRELHSCSVQLAVATV